MRVTSLTSPYNANPGDYVMVDSSAGAVIINLPVLGSLQGVDVEQDSATALSNTITVNGPASVNVDQPPPNNGTFVASFVWGPGTTWASPVGLGMHLRWFNGGSSGGYSLQ